MNDRPTEIKLTPAMTDSRLTEIKARVAAERELHYLSTNAQRWLSDLEYALGEIERLHDISAFNGLTEQVKALSAERDRLLGEIERLKGEVVIEREHYDLICEQVNGLVLQRDRLRAGLQRAFDELDDILEDWQLEGRRGPRYEKLKRETDAVRVALGDGKPVHTTACLIRQSGGWPCTCRAALEGSK